MQPQSDHINLFIDLRYMLCAVKPGGFSSMVAWPDPGGGGGGGVLGVTGPPPPPPPPLPAQLYTNVDLFGFHSGLEDREA